MSRKQIQAAILAGMTAALLIAGCGKADGEAGGKADGKAGGEESAQSETEQAASYQEIAFTDPEEVALELDSEENPHFSGEDIRGISVVEAGQPLYQLNYTPRNDRDSFLFWDMPKPYGSTVVVDTEAMYQLFEKVAALDFDTATVEDAATTEDAAIVEDAAPAGDAATAGESSGTYITVNYFAGEEEEQQDQPNRTLTLYVGENSEGFYSCTKKGSEGTPFLLEETAVEEILHASPYNLILKIPYLINVATVKEVDVRYEGKEYAMEREGDVYKINGKEVDSARYLDLYSDLMQPMLDGEIPEDAVLAEDREPIIVLQYIRSLEDAADYLVEIYENEDNAYSIEVNGAEHFYLAPEDVKTLEEAITEGFS